MAPTNPNADKGPEAPDDAHDRLDEVAEKIEEGRDALEDHQAAEGDVPRFAQDGSIRTDLIDDAIGPAS